jgi:hypothetical protein
VARVTGYDFLLLLFEKYSLVLKAVVSCTDFKGRIHKNA